MPFDRRTFFDSVRADLFNGSMSQSQVDGMNAILTAWEARPPSNDVRHLAYMLATTFHETAQAMQPIEEYGKGEGMAYGNPDPKTGETYYGRGFVQLTWADNYQRADDELRLPKELSCYDTASNALRPLIAALIMFRGMMTGWFRAPNTLPLYFNDQSDDAYGAREIINGDKTKVPSWSDGVPIGNVIAEYHAAFLEALDASGKTPSAEGKASVAIAITASPGIEVHVYRDDAIFGRTSQSAG